MKKIIFLFFLLALITAGCTMLESKQNSLSLEEAKSRIVSYINTNLMQPGQEVSVKEITEEDNLYKVVVNLSSGQEIISYMTRDGKLFFPQAMEITEANPADQTAENQPAAAQPVPEVQKAEKAKVELFVMSFCPYGVIAERAMSPVVDLMGKVADIEVHYIASITGDDINQVKSLHGPIEGIEDARQICVLNNYGQDVFWNYVDEINEKCYPIYRNGDDVYTACWQTAARNAGADIATLESCVKEEGPALIVKEDELANSYGVSGSPTLIINGAKVNAARTPEGYKDAICAGFENPPVECETELSQEGGSASGGC